MSPSQPLETAAQAITGQFTLQAQLPQGKSFSVTGYVYDGESKQSLNQRIDLLHDVLDRQRTRAEIPEIEAKVNQTIEQLKGNRIAYALMLDKRDNGLKLTQQEKEALRVMDVNNKAYEERIAEGRQRVEEMRAEIAQS